MIRAVETLTERTLLEEGVVLPVNPAARRPLEPTVAFAPGVRLRVGPGQAELVAKRIVAGPSGCPEQLVVDTSLQAHEWAPVWEGQPKEQCDG